MWNWFETNIDYQDTQMFLDLHQECPLWVQYYSSCNNLISKSSHSKDRTIISCQITIDGIWWTRDLVHNHSTIDGCYSTHQNTKPNHFGLLLGHLLVSASPCVAQRGEARWATEFGLWWLWFSTYDLVYQISHIWSLCGMFIIPWLTNLNCNGFVPKFPN